MNKDIGDTTGEQMEYRKANIVLAKAVQTCFACPSQWDAWDTEGNKYYLRYRFGRGTMSQDLGDDVYEVVASWQSGDPLDGIIDLKDFAWMSGVKLAKDIQLSEEEPTTWLIIVDKNIR